MRLLERLGRPVAANMRHTTYGFSLRILLLAWIGRLFGIGFHIEGFPFGADPSFKRDGYSTTVESFDTAPSQELPAQPPMRRHKQGHVLPLTGQPLPTVHGRESAI